jgi:hypothetical protein
VETDSSSFTCNPLVQKRAARASGRQRERERYTGRGRRKEKEDKQREIKIKGQINIGKVHNK